MVVVESAALTLLSSFGTVDKHYTYTLPKEDTNNDSNDVMDVIDVEDDEDDEDGAELEEESDEQPRIVSIS